MRWLEQMGKASEDRGLFAAIRCTLVDNKRHRAYPFLARLGIALDDQPRMFAAGLYAMHPVHREGGNFGETCRRLDQMAPSNGDDKMSSTERRFQHLLAADQDEVYSRVLRLCLYAKANDIGVDYEKLEADLRYWGDAVKRRWAMSFWRADKGAGEAGEGGES